MEQASLKGAEREKVHISQEALLKGLKVPEVEIHVPELGGVVVIKPLTLDEREKVYRAAQTGPDGQPGSIVASKFTALTVIHGLVRPRIGMEQLQALMSGNVKVIDRIAKEIWRLSGLENPEIVKNA